MTRDAQVARYQAAQRSHNWREQWWSREDAIPMLAQLLEAIEKAGPEAKLLAQRALDDRGHETLWLCVEDGEVYGLGFNKSHPCPPQCD